MFDLYTNIYYPLDLIFTCFLGIEALCTFALGVKLFGFLTGDGLLDSTNDDSTLFLAMIFSIE